jgi:hypothetical protein
MQRRGLMLGSAAILAGAIGPRAQAAAAPVAIELFTSQGCSSCPPADRFLGELSRDPAVIALAWHVDYWNGLGWPDPFATRFATDRQRAYAAQLREEVYTPALVIGGARMLVGSNRPDIHAAIQTAAPPAVPVAIVPDGAGMAAEVGAAGRPVSALLAFYEPEHLTTVSRGENGGRQLREFRIVRGARTLGTWEGTPRRFDLPAIPPGLGIAVLVQSADLRVLGAADKRPAIS